MVFASFSSLFWSKNFNNGNLPLVKICGHTDEESSRQNVGLDFAFQIPGTFEKEEKQKNCSEERNGESDRGGDGSSSFIVKKTRISVQLQLQLDSLRTRVVSLFRDTRPHL